MLVIGVGFVGFGLLGASALRLQRRPHFSMRVALLCLGMAAAQLGLFGAMDQKLLPQHVLMLFWLVLTLGALIVAPVCCYRGTGSTPGSSDGGGGGRGTDPSPPSGPRGGIPLADAGQSDVRVRDHARPRMYRPGPRRAAREPARLPTRRRSLT